MAKRRKKTRSGSSTFTVFLMGLIVGAASTALFIGVVRDQPMNIGTGINKILEQKQADSTAQTTPDQGDESEFAILKDGAFRYDFYEILIEDRDKSVLGDKPVTDTQTSVSTQDSSTVTAATQASNASQPSAAPATEPGAAYVLQVGSYHVYDDADKVKAKLALSGISSFIQKATVDGRDYFRVRTGPYENVRNMNSVHDSLAKLGYEPLKYKLSPRG